MELKFFKKDFNVENKTYMIRDTRTGIKRVIERESAVKKSSMWKVKIWKIKGKKEVNENLITALYR